MPLQPIRSLLAGRHASRLRGRGLNFEEIRRYLPGDDVRQIDWKATVRTRKTQLRVYTEERERTVLLLVDQRMGMFFGSVRNMKSVAAAETAALAAWRVLGQKDRIGALVFNDSAIDSVAPQRSQAAVMKILKAVAARNQSLSVAKAVRPNPAMLNSVLQRASNLVKHDSLVCLISDGRGHDDETRHLLSRIAAHNDVLLCLVTDPMEADLPEAGQLVFSDGRLQIQVDTGRPAIRARVRSDYVGRLDDARKFLLQKEIPILPLTAAEDVGVQLRRYLGGFQK